VGWGDAFVDARACCVQSSGGRPQGQTPQGGLRTECPGSFPLLHGRLAGQRLHPMPQPAGSVEDPGALPGPQRAVGRQNDSRCFACPRIRHRPGVCWPSGSSPALAQGTAAWNRPRRRAPGDWRDPSFGGHARRMAASNLAASSAIVGGPQREAAHPRLFACPPGRRKHRWAALSIPLFTL